MNKEEWVEKCAQQFKKRAALGDSEAAYNAELCWVNSDKGDLPEDAADSEMSYWSDDG